MQKALTTSHEVFVGVMLAELVPFLRLDEALENAA